MNAGIRSHLARYQPSKTPPEVIKREGWRELGVLVVEPDTQPGLTWEQREYLRRIAEQLYGRRANV